MRKFTPKEKDRVLNAFYCEPLVYVKPDKEIIDILCADGYITHKQEAKATTYYITDKGKGFIRLGGYTEKARQKRQNFIINAAITAITSAIGAIIGTIVLGSIT